MSMNDKVKQSNAIEQQLLFFIISSQTGQHPHYHSTKIATQNPAHELPITFIFNRWRAPHLVGLYLILRDK